MSTAYSAPQGEAGPADPDFSPDTLCGADGRLLCVPEQILGVCLEGDGPELEQSVRRATRRLQLRHHPDRPHGSAFLSRYVNTGFTRSISRFVSGAHALSAHMF